MHYHSDNKTSKTLVRLGKAIIRKPLLLTGTVGATEPPVVVAGAPPVGNVLFQLGDEETAPVVAAAGMLSVVTPEGTDVDAEVAALETAAEEEPAGLHVPAEALFNRVSLSPSVPSEP